MDDFNIMSLLDKPIDQKVCSICTETKPVFDFHTNNSFKDRRDNRCKDCIRKVMKNRYDKNKEAMVHIDLSTKCCRVCFEEKDISCFSIDRSKQDDHSTQCKTCYNKYNDSISERRKAQRKLRSEQHKDRDNARSRQWALANPERVKEKNLSKYGLTFEEFQSMVKSQNGLCQICKYTLVPGRHTHVDHCHTTNKVRGILCHQCNTKLGWFENNSNSVLSYLERYRSS